LIINWTFDVGITPKALHRIAAGLRRFATNPSEAMQSFQGST